MTRRLLLFTFAVSSLVLTSMSYAESQLSCLEKSQGRFILWNSLWGKDKLDDGVEYLITNVDVKNRMPNRTVTLQLKASKKASILVREAIINAEDTARSYCQRLITYNSPLTMPGESNISEITGKKLEQSRKAEYPYIEYSNGSWRRTVLKNNISVKECQVLSRKFLCQEEQLKAHGSFLKQLEEEIQVEQKFANPHF